MTLAKWEHDVKTENLMSQTSKRNKFPALIINMTLFSWHTHWTSRHMRALIGVQKMSACVTRWHAHTNETRTLYMSFGRSVKEASCPLLGWTGHSSDKWQSLQRGSRGEAGGDTEESAEVDVTTLD